MAFFVESSARFSSATVPRRVRWTLSAAGLSLWGLLAVAAMLQPDPSGLGTHRQLGLPPCTFSLLFGVRCPTCGMTTAWSNVMHGRATAALQANVCGVLLALATFGGGGWCLATAARGRWSFGAPSETSVACLALVVLALILLEWSLRLYLFRD